jgi:hypothetical protein
MDGHDPFLARRGGPGARKRRRSLRAACVVVARL